MDKAIMKVTVQIYNSGTVWEM